MQYEFEAKPLGDGWMEVRFVYQSSAKDDQHHQHTFADRAVRNTGQFVLSFAANLAGRIGAHDLAREIMRLWEVIHARSGCSCGQKLS